MQIQSLSEQSQLNHSVPITLFLDGHCFYLFNVVVLSLMVPHQKHLQSFVENIDGQDHLKR